MQSSLKNMILVMLGITLICSAAVGGVYTLTSDTIEQAKADKLKAAFGEVLPEFDNLANATVEINDETLSVNTASLNGATVGYAVESTTNGFGGAIKMVVGFDAEGVVTGVKILEHGETPGLGSNMTKPGNALLGSFMGKNPRDMKLAVKKDGGDVDALTAATITSRAYVRGIEKAFGAYLKTKGDSGADAYSGANKTVEGDGKEYDNE